MCPLCSHTTKPGQRYDHQNSWLASAPDAAQRDGGHARAAAVGREDIALTRRRVLQAGMNEFAKDLAELCRDSFYIKMPDGNWYEARCFLFGALADGLEQQAQTGCNVDSCIACESPTHKLDDTSRYLALSYVGPCPQRCSDSSSQTMI